LRGSSYYGQPVKRFANLQGFFNVNLAQLRKIRDQRRSALSAKKTGQAKSDAYCLGPAFSCK